ncbi:MULTISPECIES: TrmH family RNA methyltransferase [Mycobacterium]|uniref:RNA methyltransferase n=1 Tax=Mycobacterium syngnathidarum TaxID=1908205 RepID=A0A1Q9W8T7_9MYCO|nr:MULTISPECIES: RNA methyltransferase [Mycobacterium]MCG7611215.1 RNA methyltransferase [Mycobacterium sp. CnD-18-1]OHT90901.1 RNA methyltransferase [Mycobacterium syngnathidarum]OLT95210.1 RNA methyltransferase [Mycobacterium syngnathidarum]
MAAAVKLQRHIGRRRAARFLAEGPNLVEAALRRGLVSEVFATEAALDRFGGILADAPVQLVTERAAKALSDTVTPVGLVAVCRLPDVLLDEVLSAAPRLVAVAVQISEPGNAGTLIRAADAMGADAVVLAGNSVDPYNSKCLRASAGSIFSLPVISEPDEAATVARLQAAGLQVLATTIDGEVSLDEVDLTGPTAWLFGPEAHGLPTELAAAADHRVHIPMPGQSESLNISSAASICLYQSARAHRGG